MSASSLESPGTPLDFLDFGLDLGDIKFVMPDCGADGLVFSLELRRLDNRELLPLLKVNL